MHTETGQLPTILIFQAHDVAGRPAPAHFEHAVHTRSVNTLGSDAMDFLRPLNPRRTPVAGVFSYQDPRHGSGELRLRGFSPVDAQRVQELVEMSEIESTVGPEPLKPADLEVGRALVPRTNNPWVMMTFGAVLLALGILLFTRIGAVGSDTTVYVVMGALLALVGTACIVVGLIRVRWWHRARAHARRDGGVLPPDVRGL